MNEIDQIQVNFSENLWVLNICLSFIMFSVALDLKVSDFKSIIQHPKIALAGIFSQYIAFPFVAFLFIKITQPHPTIALGLLLVVVCPSGNISNFLTHTAKGNIALAISLTGISTILAPISAPFLFTFYANMDAGMQSILKNFHIGFLEMLQSVSVLLLFPILLALLLNYKFPNFVLRIKKTIKIFSLLIFIAFLIFAFKANFEVFKKYVSLVLWVVFLLDLLGFIIGYYTGKLFRLNYSDCKTLSIETGIHNAGLGLVLIFSFFSGIGGMALVAAWWGIWHLFAGMAIAQYWKRKAEN